MPVGLQSKILRIVQDGKVRRVGALKEIKFDLKIISSVNQDLMYPLPTEASGQTCSTGWGWYSFISCR